jgi:hypothetical protein
VKIPGSLFQKRVGFICKKISVYPFKGIVSRDFVVCFLVSFDKSHISTYQEWVLFAFKSSFSCRIFRFLCMDVVSPRRKMARNLVLVRGYICYCLHLSVLPTSGKIFLARLGEKFDLRRKISVAVAKLSFAA